MRRPVGFSLILVFAVSLSLFPQQPKYQAKVELVSLDIEVLDASENPVLGLTRDKFVVKENGRPVEVTNFSWYADRPVSLAFVLDTSALSVERLITLKHFIRTLAGDLARTDELCLYSFDNRNAYLEMGLSAKRGELDFALDNIAVPSKGTGGGWREIFSADPYIGLGVDRALRELQKGSFPKKALLLISNRFRGLGPVTVDHVREAGCTFMTLGSDSKATLMVTLGGDWISKQSVMKQSGGRRFPANPNDIESICGRIIFSLKNYYALGYLTEMSETEKKPRRIEIQIPGEKYRVHYRRTYGGQGNRR